MLGFALGAALLYWVLKDVDFADVAEKLRRSSASLWILAIVVAHLTFPLRALRWRTILEPVAPGVPFGVLWRSVCIGMMANNVLPGRIGEVVRAYSLTRESDVPFTTSLASLVVDRVFDAVVVLMLLMVALTDPAFNTSMAVGEKKVGAMIAGLAIVVVVAMGGLLFTVFAPAQIERLVGSVAHRVAPKFEMRLRSMVHSFAGGLHVLRDPRKFAAVFAWTLAHWIVNAAAFWIGFKALGLSMPVTGALFVQGLIVIGVSVPGLPGFFGPFEGAALVAVTQYGFDKAQATAWAVGYHVLTFIPITVIGLWYAARAGLSLGELKRARGEQK